MKKAHPVPARRGRRNSASSPFRYPAIIAIIAITAIIANGCATNPVTGKRELSLVSESQEIAMGKEAAVEVAKSIGLVEDPAIQSYVSGLAMPMATKSERPNLPWSFQVVEDEAVNAFALPGGPVFVTRGILAHMNSEAQLVSVLGHEMGHITARHSASQISKSQVAQIAFVGTMIALPQLAKFADPASQALGIAFLKFGRDDETQADELGFKYMVAAGYDPHEMGEMFRTLGRLSAGSGARVPEWMSTHPDPGNRVQKTAQRIAATPTLPTNLRVERESFVRRLEGLMFGTNPRLGFFRGTTFMHPDLKFQFDFPTGWKTQNQPTQVVGASSAEDAMVALSFAEGNPTPAAALNAFYARQGFTNLGSNNAAINGFTAASGSFSAAQEGGTLSGWVAFYNVDGATMRIAGYTTSDKFNTYNAALRQAATSLRRLTDQSALNVKPARVRLMRTNTTMTLDAFNRANPSSISLGQLALINGVDSSATISAGTLVKRVVVDR